MKTILIILAIIVILAFAFGLFRRRGRTGRRL